MGMLHSLPVRERPVYKVTKLPSYQSSLAELLAALMGGADQLELAYALLARFGGSLGAMVRATDTEIREVSGIGPALAARLKAGLELGRRIMTDGLDDQPILRSPGDIAQILMPKLAHLEQEHFVVLLLNHRNQLLAEVDLYTGNGNAIHVEAREVFRQAVRRGAATIIIAHNHPTGDPSPSPEDVAMTRQMVEAGKLMDIEVLDHLIIGQQCFVSLRERGLGFERK